MNKYLVDGHEINTFKTEEEFKELINKVNMIKVVNDVFDDNRECYVYTLENDDQISVSEWEYSTMKLFKSEKGLTYKPVVNENEDADDLNIEYVGFQLIN